MRGRLMGDRAERRAGQRTQRANLSVKSAHISDGSDYRQPGQSLEFSCKLNASDSRGR